MGARTGSEEDRRCQRVREVRVLECWVFTGTKIKVGDVVKDSTKTGYWCFYHNLFFLFCFVANDDLENKSFAATDETISRAIRIVDFEVKSFIRIFFMQFDHISSIFNLDDVEHRCKDRGPTDREVRPS